MRLPVPNIVRGMRGHMSQSNHIWCWVSGQMSPTITQNKNIYINIRICIYMYNYISIHLYENIHVYIYIIIFQKILYIYIYYINTNLLFSLPTQETLGASDASSISVFTMGATQYLHFDEAGIIMCIMDHHGSFWFLMKPKPESGKASLHANSCCCWKIHAT